MILEDKTNSDSTKVSGTSSWFPKRTWRNKEPSITMFYLWSVQLYMMLEVCLWKHQLNCRKHAAIANNQHYEKAKLRRNQFLTRERVDIDTASMMEKTVAIYVGNNSTTYLQISNNLFIV